MSLVSMHSQQDSECDESLLGVRHCLLLNSLTELPQCIRTQLKTDLSILKYPCIKWLSLHAIFHGTERQQLACQPAKQLQHDWYQNRLYTE